MSDAYGMHVRFTAMPGKGDALEALLLQAADGVRANEECLLYVVSRTPEEPDAVVVTEAWTSRAAHDAALEEAAARELVASAMPLIAGAPAAEHLLPIGGKGL